MRLFESIIDANHRAVAGDASAGLHPDEFADALPVAALTCIDPRLNAFFPNALALPPEQFIWLRNAGNIITSTLSSTMRSLALASAVKGAREIAVIGHTDCQVCKTTTMQLLDKLKALGVDRSRLPENINQFFGTFGSERQNVIKACDFIRNSPLIGPKIPVHGLLLDIGTGKLEWLVNGYDALQTQAASGLPAMPGPKPTDALGAIGAFKDFAMGEMKFPEMKIGEMAARLGAEASQERAKLGGTVAQNIQAAAQSAQEIIGEASQYVLKKSPPPPPIQMKPSALPPMKRKIPPPLPTRPGRDFGRG
jgi:carbonic anhydrase